MGAISGDWVPEADDKQEVNWWTHIQLRWSILSLLPPPKSVLFCWRGQKKLPFRRSYFSLTLTLTLTLTNLKRISLNFRITPLTPLTCRHQERFVLLIFNLPLIKPGGSGFAPSLCVCGLNQDWKVRNQKPSEVTNSAWGMSHFSCKKEKNTS